MYNSQIGRDTNIGFPTTESKPKFDYIAADATARAALTGMVAKQTCRQTDTNMTYIYTGSAWSLLVTLG